MSTHAELHSVTGGNEGVHRHVPPTQISGAVQVVPQLPQLFESELVTVQRALAPEPHTISPCEQVTWHAPVVQTLPGPHVEPHVPQLPGSFCVSTHTPPHAL